MANLSVYNVLLGSVTTEQTTDFASYGKYVFKVAPTADKKLIKTAVEKLFNVTVRAVNTINVKGKKTRFRQREGRKQDWKKAIVSLAAGQSINLEEF